MPADSQTLCRSFRTLLFVPGSRMDRVAKAHGSAADIVCIDLEDAVPPAEKDDARDAVIKYCQSAMTDRTAVRINGMRTRAGIEDLRALADAPLRPSIVLVPMVESAVELEIAQAVLADPAIALVPLVETVKGLAAIDEIGRAASVECVMFGGGDLAAQLGVDLAWEPLLQARGEFVLGCVRAGVRAVDVPFIDVKDESGLRRETERAKALGFTAKAVIHPVQIDTVKRVLRPSPEEVARANAALSAYREAGGETVLFQGMMLDDPIVRRFKSIADMGSEAEDA